MKHFFHVRRSPTIPRDHYAYGYEEHDKFTEAVWRLHRRWNGWTGECIEERHDFMLIRFRGAYDYEDVWMPDFMLEAVPPPNAELQHRDSIDSELLDEIYGFD